MDTALDKYADMEPQWDHPVVIESHINGVRSKEMNPNTPITYAEFAEDAIRCWEAGAGTIHAHNTSFDLLGENAYHDYMRTWEKVLQKHPDIPWYPTTCNNLRLTGDENGLEHVAFLNDNANARIACVNTGLTLFATGRDSDGHLGIVQAASLVISGATTVYVTENSDLLAPLFGTALVGLPAAFWLAVILAALLWALLRRTAVGQGMTAVGLNEWGRSSQGCGRAGSRCWRSPSPGCSRALRAS